MTEPVSSSSSSSLHQSSGGMTIDIRPMIEDVSQVMTKHITKILSGVIGEYTVYKETHDTIMGLPCVRKLQERICELEKGLQSSASEVSPSDSGGGSTRENEITQLQSAIVELNRYIVALESKVDMKTVCSSSTSSEQQNKHDDEEAVRLEVHEDDIDNADTQSQSEVVVHNTFTHSSANIENTIITTTDGEFETPADDEDNGSVDDETEGLAEDNDDVVDVEQNEKEGEEKDEEDDDEEEEISHNEEDTVNEQDGVNDEADDEEADDEEADEEEEEAAEEEEEEDAEEEEEDAEEEEEEEEDEAEEDAEEAEIEVSEVIIKGKKYFTTDSQNGTIYACVDDDVGDEVGVFKNGVAVFNKGKK